MVDVAVLLHGGLIDSATVSTTGDITIVRHGDQGGTFSSFMASCQSLLRGALFASPSAAPPKRSPGI